MSVNFNSILGGVGGGAAGFPLTLEITIAASSSDSGGTEVQNRSATTKTFTITKENGEFTISPSPIDSRSKTSTGIELQNIFATILSMSIEPATSRSVGNGIYLVSVNNELTPVSFEEYREFIKELEAQKEARKAAAEVNKVTNGETQV